MGIFKNTPPSKTVLLLDIDNGSVGSALATLAAHEAPQLFAARRIYAPMLDTRSAATLMRGIESAASEALLHASESSARLRASEFSHAPISKTVVFLAAPWGVPNLQTGRPDLSHALLSTLDPRARALFDVPMAVHAHASAALHGLRTLYPAQTDALLVSVGGEVTELLLIRGGAAVGHATAPTGLHTALRTLKTHAGLSAEEARSALKLGTQNEAMHAAAAHFAGEFGEAAHELAGAGEAGKVFVLAHEPGAEWFARALTHRSLAGLFTRGGSVRALRGGSFAPFIRAQGIPDTHLALAGLYAASAH